MGLITASNNNSLKVKLKKIKIGLLIQGPIISTGRTGNSPLSSVIHDSRKCLLDLVGGLSKNDFDEIVISTWKTLESCQFEKSNKLPKYVEFLHISENEMKNECTLDDIDNEAGSKYFQYYLTYKGVLELKSKGVDYVIKCRTDQLIDLIKIKKYILDQFDFYDKFFVTHLERKKPFWVNDFYFGASTSNMVDVFERLLFSRSFSGSVHTDLFRSIAYNSLSTSKEFPKLFIFFKNHRLVAESRECENYYSYILNCVIKPLPRSVYTSIVWRGELLHKRAYFEYIFSEEWNFKSYKLNDDNANRVFTIMNFLFLFDLAFIIWNKFGCKVKYSSTMSKLFHLFFIKKVGVSGK
jgi:hypothetical protein